MSEALIKALQPVLLRVRRDVHWIKDKDGTQSLRKTPLTKALMLKHLAGGPACGVAAILPGQSTTRIAVLDFDSHQGESTWEAMQEAAQRVAGALDLCGYAPLAFRSSGGRGIHLYLLWEAEQDAYSVRQALTMVLAGCGFANGPAGVARGEVEVFPKQDAVAQDKFGNQFILPLAGKSVPLNTDWSDLPQDALTASDWQLSAPVPVKVKPERAPLAAVQSVDLAEIRAALDAIPNAGDQELDYDQWRNIIFALHHATSGSDEGLALAVEFSQRSSKCDIAFLENRVWPYIDSQHPDAVTERSLFAKAREHGWSESIEEFFEPIEVPAVLIEVSPAPGLPATQEQAQLPAPAFVRDKQGGIEATVDNIVKAVRRSDICGFEIGYDEFRDEITVARPGTNEWVPMADADVVRLRIHLEKIGFKGAPKETCRDAITLVAAEHAYDSAILWLKGLQPQWDGVARCEKALQTYFGAEASPYTRAVSMYMWTALAGRVLSPGCQADMVPVLQGKQGIRKTSVVKALCPDPNFFTEIDFNDKEENTVRKMRGVLVGEIAELAGIKTRDRESILKFITRTHEKWIPKFREFQTMFARRLLFIATTNHADFLDGDTEYRRWLPVPVTRTDPEAIARDRDQLWAEAAHLFEARGVVWQAAEAMARDEHSAFTAHDPWEDVIGDWLAQDSGDTALSAPTGIRNLERPFKTLDLMTQAFAMRPVDISRLVQSRAALCLRKLGFDQHRTSKDGVMGMYWMPKEKIEALKYLVKRRAHVNEVLKNRDMSRREIPIEQRVQALREKQAARRARQAAKHGVDDLL